MAKAPAGDRRTSEFKILRQAMGYCWSVVVVALPDKGRAAMEGWLATKDPDILWVMRENLRKARLARMDPVWVERWSKRV